MPALEFRSFHSRRSCENVPKTALLSTLPPVGGRADPWAVSRNNHSTLGECAVSWAGARYREISRYASTISRSARSCYMLVSRVRGVCAISFAGRDIGALPRYRARTTILLTGLQNREISRYRDPPINIAQTSGLVLNAPMLPASRECPHGLITELHPVRLQSADLFWCNAHPETRTCMPSQDNFDPIRGPRAGS